MSRYFRINRFLAALMLLGVFALAAPRAVAGEVAFRVDGTFTVAEKAGPNSNWVDLEGKATPGGPFVGRFVAHGKGQSIYGTFTLQFGGGTLTFDYLVTFDHDTGIYEGDFVITGGTGAFEGASGQGEVCYPLDAITQPFMMDGVLIR